jgi:hypothetical protein
MLANTSPRRALVGRRRVADDLVVREYLAGLHAQHGERT